MQELTKQNIRTITETIDRAEISFSHLREDLIDHVCCEIEAELKRGLDFNKAFEKIKKNFGIKSLQQVQEKTLLLIDKNYCAMKKTMKVSGIISTILLMFGSLFKIQHWPGAGAMLALGFFVLCFLFLPSANYVMHRERKDRSMILLFISAFLGSFGLFLGFLFKIMHWPGAGIVLALGCVILCVLFFPFLLRYLIKNASSGREKTIYTIGVISGIVYNAGFLFKMNHWPGASLLLLAGALILVVIFLPLYTRFKYRQSERIEASFLYIVAALTWFLLFTMLISVTISRDIMKEFVFTEKKNKAVINYLHQKNELIYSGEGKMANDSLLQEVKAITSNLDTYIQNLKIEIVQNMDGNSHCAITNKKSIEMNKIVDKTNIDVPFFILIGEKLDGKAFQLRKKIDQTKEKMLSLVNDDKATITVIELCLNTNIPANSPEWIKSWEMFYFNHITVAGCLNVLTGIQKNLSMAENEVINYIINQ